jgi:ELWxxDGT repeat protein
LDDDGDGTMNDVDICPNTPSGTTVDPTGCEAIEDADGDGVVDSDDICPETTAGESVDANGCSTTQLDADNDGVPDADDTCPETTAGESVDANGCSTIQLDADNDGVPDADDTCPDTTAGESVDANGCSTTQLDADNDGVPDADDICPETKYGFGVDQLGCEILSAVIIKDINVGNSSSSPSEFTTMGGLIYFRAYTEESGWELWRSDGTGQGTYEVKDIRPGASSGYPDHITPLGNHIYFIADDGEHGWELWKSDGTSSGTNMVKDIKQGSDYYYISEIVALENRIYFPTQVNANGDVRLFTSDGTESGTHITTGAGWQQEQFTTAGGNLFFTATDYAATSGQRELYRCDGSENCDRVKNLNGDDSSYPDALTSYNDELYFFAEGGDDLGRELWKSDGSSWGTELVIDLKTNDGGLFSTSDGIPGYATLIVWNHSESDKKRLYFDGFDGLYSTDGTESGTVKENGLGTGLTPFGDYMFHFIDGELFKSYYEISGGYEFFRTEIVAEFNLSFENHNNLVMLPQLYNTGELHFMFYNLDASFTISSFELWSTEPTTNETKLLLYGDEGGGLDFYGVISGIDPGIGILYLPYFDDLYGWELWSLS